MKKSQQREDKKKRKKDTVSKDAFDTMLKIMKGMQKMQQQIRS